MTKVQLTIHHGVTDDAVQRQRALKDESERTSLIYSSSFYYGVVPERMGRKSRERLTAARCVGVRPPKMKVGVLLIARALSCSDF